MSWEQLEGSWNQLKGTAKQKWGKLTNNEVECAAGERDRLAGKLQERYGVAKQEAEKIVDKWLSMQAEMEAEREQRRSAKS